MSAYRDPFDLSPAPKAPTHTNVKGKPTSKAVVRRVSIGPLLHSRFTKLLAALGLIILAGLASYVATYLYLIKQQ